MRRLRLRSTSRYKSTPLFQDGRELTFFGSWNPPSIEPNDRVDQFYHVKRGDIGRLDHLAVQFYGDPALWWVIAQANNITNPFDMQVDQVLRIPAESAITAIINAQRFQDRQDA